MKKQKKETKTIKKQNQNIIIVSLILLILVCLVIIGYAYAKYKESFDENATAQVAKWSFKVNDSEEGMQTFNLVNTINKTESVQEGKVAPGTSGYFDLKLDGRGSETAINYIINVDLENKPQNMHFYLDENYTIELAVEENKIIINDFIPLQEVENVKIVRLHWNWPYETGNTEQERFKNNIIDTETSGKDMTANVTVTGMQVSPETKQASYKVHYYLENANDNKFTKYTSQTYTYTKNTDTELTLSNIAANGDVKIPNAQYAYGSSTPEGEHISNIEIKEDGTTEIYLYYLRNRYELKLSAGENIEKVKSEGLSTGTSNNTSIPTENGNKEFEQSKTQMKTKYKYGETVTITATPENIPGYTNTFKKWEVTAEDKNSLNTQNETKVQNETNTQERMELTAQNQSTLNLGSQYKETEATTIITMPEENIEIKGSANKLANNYSITFDANTGEGTIPNQGYVYDIAQTLTKNTFTKTGYTFKNWNTLADGTGTSYNDEQEVKNLVETANGSITLYAQWNPNEYTVVFNANGGTGSMNVQNFKYDEEQALQENTLTRNGYTFTGWNLAPDGSDTNYSNKESILNLTANKGEQITLYAMWSTNSYTVEFNKNGGSEITGTMPNQTLTYDTERNLRANTFTKPGYTFEGWTKEPNGTGTIYKDRELVSNLTTSGTITLYAKWTKNKYTVIYNSNAPEETITGKMENSQFEFDTNGNLKENTYIRIGYKFKEWNTSANRTGTTYSNRAEVKNLTETPNATVTLYAQWTPNTYRINFNSNTGTGSMETQTCTYDALANLTTNTFTKPGYTFANWNTKADGTGTSYNNSQEITNLIQTDNGSITLYAQWTANTNTQYKVTHYVMNTSGIYIESLQESLTGTTDTKITINNLIKKTPAYNVTNGIYCKKAVINGKEEIEITQNKAEGEEATTEETNNVQATIKPDGSLEIAIYYARTYGYLTIAKGENITKTTIGESSELNHKLYYYGQNLPEITATVGFEQGYLINFEKWESSNSEYVQDITTNQIKDYTWKAMPEGTEITLTAKATKVESDQTPYKVNYYLENSNNEEYTLYSTKTNAGTTNSQITLSDVQINLANCTINTNKTNITEETKITADGTTEINVYYNRNKYELNIIGGDNIAEAKAIIENNELSTSNEENVNNTSNKTITKELKWGQTIKIEASLKSEEGYTYKFTGWETESKANLGIDYAPSKEATQIVMPAENINITATASKTANTYTIIYNANTGNGTMANQVFTYGIAQKLSKNSYTKPGYTFKGWATEESLNNVDAKDSVNSNASVIQSKNNKTADENGVVYIDEEEILNLTSTPNQTITLYAVWKDETAPQITLTKEVTTNSITVNVTAVELGSGLVGNYKYYIGTKNAITSEIEYQEPIEKTEKTHTFESLVDNTTYYIKVETLDKSGNLGKIENITVDNKKVDYEEITTQELVGEVTYTDEYWSNGKYVVTLNTEAKDSNNNPYEIQYQVLTKEEIEAGKVFDEESNWNEKTIKTGTVLGLEQNNTDTNTENSNVESNGNDTNREESGNNENETTENTQNNIILKDGDILYARIYDGVNGAKTYSNLEIINQAKKTYTEEEMAQVSYAAATYDILTYSAKPEGFNVNIEKEITGVSQYNYYAKANGENEYKLISTSTNWNDPADVTNELLQKLGKQEKDMLKENETYKVKVLTLTLDQAGNISNTTKCVNTATIIMQDKAEAGKAYSQNRTYIDNEHYTSTIPASFKVSTKENENTISKGMVLQDAKGNEFVWVPVDEAVYIKGAGTIPTNASNGNTYYKPMAIAQSANSNNYESIVYTYSGVKSYRNTSSNIGVGKLSYREPSLITGNTSDGYTWNTSNTPAGSQYDASSNNYLDTLGFSNISEYGNYMNKEYANMINSTQNYGGFYIGRYETSLSENQTGSSGNEVQSKPGQTPMSNMNWYELYLSQDSNRNGNNTYYNTNSVTSSMIWGSQYDQMLNWVLNGAEKSKLQATTYGNKTSSQSKTGSYGNDVINNIYDLVANTYEWTQEAYSTNVRAYRGSSFNNSKKENVTARGVEVNPNNLGSGYGTRQALYINNSTSEKVPAIEITSIESLVNMIKVKVQAKDSSSGISKYYYSISTEENASEENWQTFESYSPEYTFSGLAQNTTYFIKVQAQSNTGKKSLVVADSTTTESLLLEEGAIEVKGITGSSGNGILGLGVRADYASQNYYIEYQVVLGEDAIQVGKTANEENGIYTKLTENGTWITGEIIKNLYENDIVYARLTDGTNTTAYMPVNIKGLETFSSIYSKTTIYTDPTGKVATIPAGFSVGTSEKINKIDDGLVIQDEKGNQFVWVPVESALANGTAYPTNASSTSTYKPIAVYQDNSTKYYQSLLYSYNASAKTYSYVNTGEIYKIGGTGYREPSLVTGSTYDGYTWDLDSLSEIKGESYDAYAGYYNKYMKFSSVTEYGKYKNEEYKNMIDSIEHYKGFYVGRYETSIDSETMGVAQSQSGKNVLDSSNANNSGYKAIYYQDSNRNPSNPYYNSKSVTSSMIWNGQYDTMLNWILKKQENKEQVFSTTLGNHKEGTKPDESGINVDDITNNIFDLGGNVHEVTQGSNGTGAYATRGGAYYRSSSYPGTYNMTYIRTWTLNSVSTDYNNIGSRMTLYLTKQDDTIKPTITINGEPIVESNNIYFKVNAEDENSGIEKYYYYISTDGTNYTEYIGWGNSYKFENLTSGTKYYIKAKVEDKAGNISEETEVKEVTTIVINAIDDILSPRVYGSNGDGRAYFKITSEYENQGYYLEYQIVKSGGTFNANGKWTKDASSTAIGLSVGDIVYARINDGKGNISNYRSLEITELEEFETYSEYKARAETTATDVYYTYTDPEGKIAYIPKDFSVGKTASINTISKGLVVQDQEGNQYVWVPVDKNEVVYNGEKVANDGTETYKPMVQYQAGYNETTEEQYFEAVRYDYSKNYETGSKIANVSNGIISKALGGNGYREPSLVTGAANYTWLFQASNNQYDALSKYYHDICGFESATEMGAYMNEQYTNMVKSIKEYGGFYIGRYETSLTEGKVESKINKEPMDSRAGTETSSGTGNLWYGMYNKQDSLKNTRNPYYNSQTVVSSMIWGSQYDRMLNWALTGNEANMVHERTGNRSGSRSTTGRYGSDIMNNIFDLSANVLEWTQEAIYATYRAYCGGYCHAASTNVASTHGSINPTYAYSHYGSRLALYIRSSEP